MIRALDQYNHSMENEKESIHQFVEALKFAFAQRTKLGDWNDSKIKQKVNETIEYIQSEEWMQFVKNHLKIDRTSTSTDYYGADYQYISDDAGTSSIAVISSNGGLFFCPCQIEFESSSSRIRLVFESSSPRIRIWFELSSSWCIISSNQRNGLSAT